MDKLFKGVLEFQSEKFEAHRELFNKLGKGQKPHTLFIGCSDSRVVPTLITRTHPGELFMIRNVANIVPPYDMANEFVDTMSTIEYAVLSLKVDTILVCGHSGCGGCEALYSDPEDLKAMPNVAKWLGLIEEVRPRVEKKMTGDSIEERGWLTEHINILHQMRNLLTYPFILERVREGTLKILGWYYIIETGKVYNFNDKTRHFELVE